MTLLGKKLNRILICCYLFDEIGQAGNTLGEDGYAVLLKNVELSPSGTA